MGPLCPLPSCGPLWSVPLTLYLCKALCHSFLGWAGVGRGGQGGAGAGSLLSLSGWPGGSLPLPMARGMGDSGSALLVW